MATKKEDEEIFEIVDYTTASDWERFIARIEEILSEWRLNGPEISNNEIDFSAGDWINQDETLEFGNQSFVMTHFSLQESNKNTSMESMENNPAMTSSVSMEKQTFVPPRAMADMMSRRNDFPAQSPYLCHWYGLREFLTLSPQRDNDAILDEDQANLLLSSMAIAVSNVGCNVPIFIRVQHEWRKMFVGLCEGSGLRTYFNVCHVKTAPHQYRHLSGLLEIFKSKLGSNLPNDKIIMVAVRFTYVLKGFESMNGTRQVLPRDESGMPIITDLPFGSLYDPVSALHLSCTWPICSEEFVTENEETSDFDPLLSQQWAIGVKTLEDLPVLLADAVEEYFKLSSKRDTIEQLLGKTSTADDPNATMPNMADPIKRISDSRTQQYWSSISTSISTRTQRIRETIANPPLPSQVIEKTLEYLFRERAPLERQRSIVDESPSDVERIRQLKSVPKDSFVYRLTVCFLAICSLPSYNHLRAVAHLWSDVLHELRNYWENGKILPGLEAGSPNLSYSKFYQNLQMLNCCIEHRMRYQNEISQTDTSTDADADVEVDEDGDEFYECSANLSSSSKSSFTENQPEGRLKPCGDLKLLHADEPLYIPVTQECPPATEDMLDEQTTMLTNLGSGEEATLLRARIQSRSLLSDMESFKAANPLGVLEDFVRWYSPRDWIETEEVDADGKIQKRGSLSVRMQLPDNLWLEVWQQARAVPVRRQKRLFDDRKEAEKILQNFSSLTPGEVLEQLIPVLLQTVTDRVNREMEILEDPHGPSLADTLYSHALMIVKKGREERKVRIEQDYVRTLNILEQHICRFKSFREKLLPPDLTAQAEETIISVISRLHTHQEVPVAGAAKSPLGQKLVSMFTAPNKTTSTNPDDVGAAKNSFIPPAGKEYILRASIARPSQSRSRLSPQRMYCLLKQDEFRLCGAFSEDTTFF